MAFPPPILPRDCYEGWQIRKMFAERVEDGGIKIKSRAWLRYQRVRGVLPYHTFGVKIMYPRLLIDQMLQPVPNS